MPIKISRLIYIVGFILNFIEITRRLYIITTRYYVIGYIHAHLIFFTNNKDEKSWIADVCLFDILRKLE